MLNLLFILSLVHAYITIPLEESVSSKANLLLKIESISLAAGESVNGLGDSASESLLSLVDLKNAYNIEYIANIQIGTPPKKMSLDIDTGSTWIRVPSINCNFVKSNKYEYSASSSYYYPNLKYEEIYDNSAITGWVGLDTFKMDNLIVKDQAFVESYEDYILDGSVSDGVLGLGFNRIGTTFVENLKAQGQINKAIFSIYFNNIDKKNPIKSVLTIGGYDAATYGSGRMVTINVEHRYKFWASNMQGIAIGSNSKKALSSKIFFDTGASFLLGPTNEINSIHNIIKKHVQKCSMDAGTLYCPCENGKYSKFPAITFYIQNNAFVINPENYLGDVSGYCAVLISGISYSFWVLGQPFFRAYYTVHDMDNEKIYL